MNRAIFFLFSALYLAGCAGDLSGDVYSREEARKEMQVAYGTVESTRPVVIEGERNFLGQGGGAVIGGVAGNAIGSGSGRSIATAVGTVAGAVAGGATQEKATRAQGVEIIIDLDNGGSTAVVQQVKDLNEFTSGQRVRIITSEGNTRVAPLYRNNSTR